MTASARARRARGSLDIDRILDAAFALAAEVGLANLSMPQLASCLDVGVTNIYWHIRNRDELLRRMGDRAITRLTGRLPRPGDRDPGEWADYLAEYFTTQRALFANDDLLSDLMAMRYTKHDPETEERGYLGVEAVMRYLMSARFAPVDAWNLYSALFLYTQGFAVVERRSRAVGLPRTGAAQLHMLDAEATPLIAALLGEDAISLDMAGDNAFAAGLKCLLVGAAQRAGVS